MMIPFGPFRLLVLTPTVPLLWMGCFFLPSLLAEDAVRLANGKKRGFVA